MFWHIFGCRPSPHLGSCSEECSWTLHLERFVGLLSYITQRDDIAYTRWPTPSVCMQQITFFDILPCSFQYLDGLRVVGVHLTHGVVVRGGFDSPSVFMWTCAQGSQISFYAHAVPSRYSATISRVHLAVPATSLNHTLRASQFPYCAERLVEITDASM